MWIFTNVGDPQCIQPYRQLIHLESGARIFVNQHQAGGDYYLTLRYPSGDVIWLGGPCVNPEEASAMLSEIVDKMASGEQVALLEPTARYPFQMQSPIEPPE